MILKVSPFALWGKYAVFPFLGESFSNWENMLRNSGKKVYFTKFLSNFI